ncbi:MAG: hypothetical protein J0L80_02355 [Chitinophagales bacterium]|nr:hypothetical protein [Chitinophagales bacterium]
MNGQPTDKNSERAFEALVLTNKDFQLLKLDRNELLKLIKNEWSHNGFTLAQTLREHIQNIEKSDKPSEIYKEFQMVKSKGTDLEGYYKTLGEKVGTNFAEYLNKHEQDIAPRRDSLNTRKDELTTKSNDGAGTAGKGFLLISAATAFAIISGGTGAPMLAWALGAGMTVSGGGKAISAESSIDSINWDLKKLDEFIEGIQTKHKTDLVALNKDEFVTLLVNQIMEQRFIQSKKTFDVLTQYAVQHHTTNDEITLYLQKKAPHCAAALLALLRADFTTKDLQLLKEYAASASIDDSPEKLATLQFLNHSVLNHIDFFEIWASKIHDIENRKDKIRKALKEYNTTEIPKLEILGETALKLSGTKQPKPSSPHASKHGEIRALDDGTKAKTTAQQNVTSVVAQLKDTSQGDLKQRHQKACEEIAEYQNRFTHFFSGINSALKDIDVRLDRAEMKADSAWNAFASAEGLANAIAVAEFNSPEAIRDFNRKLLWSGVVAQSIGHGAVAAMTGGGSLAAQGIPVGELLAGEVRTHLQYERNKELYKLQMDSLLRRQRRDPSELHDSYKKLEEEVNKLADSKEFCTYITNSGLLQDIQATYFLLPRLRAGAININAIEKRTQKAGYAKIDDFINDLKSSNARLAEAMENSLYGIANSNDLQVLLADANRIGEPQTPKETVLVEYVETTVKKYYPDQSKQASIIDHLQARNALYTGHPFHSFSEVVKLETDSALKALFAGEGEFSLVGSNDVHRMFSYYQARHGDKRFIKLLDNVQTLDGHNRDDKATKIMDQTELDILVSDPENRHNKETLIPRVPIFLEICAYEYLLSQGANIMKDRRLINTPEVLGTYKMINQTTDYFLDKIALRQARNGKLLGHQIESLIAQTFVDFYAELGAAHVTDPDIIKHSKNLKSMYTDGNFPQASGQYADDITEKSADSFELFLRVYKHNLEHYLEVATKENKSALLEQLAGVKEMMKDIQIGDDILLPNSEGARLRAHYRNHTLNNTGISHDTWVMRTDAIYKGGREIGS